jgi:hypothetical protein
MATDEKGERDGNNDRAAPSGDAHKPLHVTFGDSIRAAANKLQAQYPQAGVDFIVHCLEYDLGMRPTTIRKALAHDTATTPATAAEPETQA